MGSCIRLRNSILTACSCFSIRFLIVLRPMTNEPHLRDRVQKCVKPRKSKGSGFPSPSFSRCLAASGRGELILDLADEHLALGERDSTARVEPGPAAPDARVPREALWNVPSR